MDLSVRRPVFLALLAALFALALGAGFAVGSSGEDERPAEPVGSAAVPFDVKAAGQERPSLGEAAPLPSLARRPKPPPREPDPEPEPALEEDVAPEPLVPEAPEPAPAPAPAPAPPPEPPPVEFDDEG